MIKIKDNEPREKKFELELKEVGDKVLLRCHVDSVQHTLMVFEETPMGYVRASKLPGQDGDHFLIERLQRVADYKQANYLQIGRES